MLKKLISLLFISIISTSSFAAYEIVNCDSIRGTNRSLSLIIVNNDVKQIRFLNPGSNRPMALMTRKLNIQNFPELTIYSAMGISSLIKVENNILAGNGGLVSIDSDEFSCF
jgi:hypothetical protein